MGEQDESTAIFHYFWETSHKSKYAYCPSEQTREQTVFWDLLS